MSLDLRLVAIADPAVLGSRDLVSASRAAVTGGATAIQLRAKNVPPAELLRWARELRAALTVPFFINDRADVALAAGAGVHLGQDDLPLHALASLIAAGLPVGISVGSETEATAARGIRAAYWSLGPLYRTASKPDAGVPLEREGFTRLARLAPAGMPVIAIGGIAAGNAAAAIEAGAGGVAVISAIFAAPGIEAAAREIRTAVDSALAARGSAG